MYQSLPRRGRSSSSTQPPVLYPHLYLRLGCLPTRRLPLRSPSSSLELLIGRGSHCGTASDELHRAHADDRVSAHDSMIVKDHLEVAQHHDDALGDLHVRSGWHWVASRMIVR